MPRYARASLKVFFEESFVFISAYLILMSRTWGLFLVPHGGGLFVLRSIMFLLLLSIARENVVSNSVVTAPLQLR